MSSLTWFFKVVTLYTIVQICLLPNGSASSNDDKITALPGQPPVKFNQYSGYITVDDIQQRSLFYYFVEAETDPKTKPLVLWLNGGPACSSLSGAFSRMGPFILDREVLKRNNLSWNQEANILFLESPAGVGFSYSSNKSFYNFINDEITARDNLKFLFGWFEKYPEYKNRDFFISGVSYAGHYIPQLANLILETRLKSNLKGVVIANPLLDFDNDYNTKAVFFWSRGLISDSTYSKLNTICNVSQIFRQSMEGNISNTCLQVYNQGVEEMGNFVDIENALIDVCLLSPFEGRGDDRGVVTCWDSEITKYFNRKDVQEALHAKLVGFNRWTHCANISDVNYNMQEMLVPTFPLLGDLVKGGVRVMIFSGDQDGKIPFISTRSLIRVVAEHLGLNTTQPYRSWLQDKQVGGWTQVYGDLLSYATVRGGGHNPSFSQPKRTLFLFNTFLKGNPLPIAPTN